MARHLWRIFRSSALVALFAVCVCCDWTAVSWADQTVPAEAAAQQRFFESEIRPLLVEHCYECHSGDEREGGLSLDRSDTLVEGGDSGALVEPGESDASLLISAVSYEGLEMPPEQPLSQKQIGLLKHWVDSGAYWPSNWGTSDSEPKSVEESASWWASKPIQPTPPRRIDRGELGGKDLAADQRPAPSSGTIDDYIDAKLIDAGLHRAPRADRARLIRRLSYDLLGVPPTPKQTEDFVRDDRPGAYVRLVDRVMSDPMYGERMARLWLDLVRYAESDGYRADAYRPSAYKYRDWVLNAFNSAMPYDQFVAYQLAGDEIAPSDPDAMAATGFLRLGIYEYNQRDAEGQWQYIVDEMTDVTGDVFLATGLACAKCHDHKFDPIPRSDYFNFRSVFEPLTFHDVVETQVQSEDSDSLLQELDEIESATLKELEKIAVERFPESVQAMYWKPSDQKSSYETQIANLVYQQVLFDWGQQSTVEKKLGKERSAERKALLEQLSKLDVKPRAPRSMMAVSDAQGAIRPTRLPGRTSGREFLPAIPEVFGGQSLEVESPVDNPQSTGRRLALVNWMVSADNPITARVIVNRLWQYHFGSGLVETPNDFGALGQKPSHPALLDDLAAKLIASRWDMKRLQRELVLSQTYQQSAVHPDSDSAMLVDARNRLHWHRSARRLDAEQFRDSLLFAMDGANLQMNGPSMKGTPPRRTIYLQRKRNEGDEMLKLMDSPTGIVGTARRDVTITPTQTLLMMNNERMLNIAARFATRVRRDLFGSGENQHTQHANSDSNKDQQAGSMSIQQAKQFVGLAYQILTSTEMDSVTEESLVPLAATGEQGQIDVCHVLLNANAFLFIE